MKATTVILALFLVVGAYLLWVILRARSKLTTQTAVAKTNTYATNSLLIDPATGFSHIVTTGYGRVPATLE